MSWTNFHGHCNFCDGAAAPEEYLKKALAQGFVAYGFSSHAPLAVANAWSMKAEKLPAYLREIETLKVRFEGQLEVYTGLEADYVPGLSSPKQLKKKWGLDYVIGSIHYADCLPDGTPWEVDGSHHTFRQGLQEIFDFNIHDFLETYFCLLREMVAQHTPDVVGHLDKIKIHNSHHPYFLETDRIYREEVEHSLELIRTRECILEVNTRGLYTRKTLQTYPSPWVLKRALALQIPIMLNSDAHRPEEISSGFAQTAALLQDLGFKELMVMREGSWQAVPFHEHGLSLLQHEKNTPLATQAE